MSHQSIETRDPARDAPSFAAKALWLNTARNERGVPEDGTQNSMPWTWKRKGLVISKEDFTNGKALDCRMCPVAAALQRVARWDAKTSFAVQADTLEFWMFDDARQVVMHVESKLSRRAIEFIEKYDHPQEDQTFELPMRIFVKIPGWMLR